MDMAWFKQMQRRKGVTSFDLGQAIQRDRSVISRIVNGSQRMTLEQARVFSELLDVPLPEMIERGGLGEKQIAQEFAPGFSESDAAAWIPGAGLSETAMIKSVASALGERPGVDVWRVKSRSMALAGLIEGDFMLVDTNQAERVKPGDIVLAQVYNRGGTMTVLRRYAPPVLISASADQADVGVHVVDGVNVMVRGKVIASWRI
jgi:SOS-response transcriptional repressor LexA